jgi:hypothetical protein
VSDPFVDALHDRLTRAAASGADRGEEDVTRAAALTRWWDEFVEVVGQKVGAWNERQAPRPPLNFTRQANGAVHVWHRSAEATCAREGDAIRVTTRLGAEPTREGLLAMRIPADGKVVAVADGAELDTPTALAEHILTPLLVKTFAKP